MAMTAVQQRHAAREMARRIYDAATRADLNLDDLQAAIGAIDATMDKLPAQLAPASTVKQNFIVALPEPFKSGSTAPQKALALALWALKEAGTL